MDDQHGTATTGLRKLHTVLGYFSLKQNWLNYGIYCEQKKTLEVGWGWRNIFFSMYILRLNLAYSVMAMYWRTLFSSGSVYRYKPTRQKL